MHAVNVACSERMVREQVQRQCSGGEWIRSQKRRAIVSSTGNWIVRRITTLEKYFLKVIGHWAASSHLFRQKYGDYYENTVWARLILLVRRRSAGWGKLLFGYTYANYSYQRISRIYSYKGNKYLWNPKYWPLGRKQPTSRRRWLIPSNFRIWFPPY